LKTFIKITVSFPNAVLYRKYLTSLSI